VKSFHCDGLLFWPYSSGYFVKLLKRGISSFCLNLKVVSLEVLVLHSTGITAHSPTSQSWLRTDIYSGGILVTQSRRLVVPFRPID
jgi:hypothetical protein